jgi:murein DD-endopeptidase MepM/ murein hydrolase activator NlpD
MSKFSLFYPVTPARINQPFGVNGAYYQANGVSVAGHNGIDFGAYHGQPIYAAHDGVAFYQTDDREGHGVIIISDKAYDCGKTQAFYKTIYWHLCDPLHEPKYTSPVYKKSGMKVKAGDIIGYADNTGLSSGDHLHFGLKPIVRGGAPRSGDAPDLGIGEWVNVEQNNGYRGSIDPTPFWNGYFAENANAYIANQTLQIGLLTKIVEILTKLLKR